MKSTLAFLGIATLVALEIVPAHATTYAYNGATGSTWSLPADWNPSTSTNGPTSGDTANLNNTASNRTVIYDSGASGLLGALTFTESSNAINELDVQKSLTVGTTTSASVVLGATGSGTVLLLVDSYTPNLLTPTANSVVAFSVGGTSLTTVGALTINSGGVLELQGGTASGSAAGDVTVNANVTLSGGTFNVDASSLSGTVVTTVGGNLVMSSGTLNLDATPSGAYSGTLAGRQILQVNGNFQVTGGTVNDVNFPATSSITLNGTTSAGNTNYYYLTTAAPIISTITLTSNATTQQNLYSNQQLGTVLLTASAATETKSLGASTSTGTAYSTGTLFVGTLKLTNTTLNSATTLQLASNVTQDNGGDQIVNAGASSNATTLTIDTNSHTLDMSSDTNSASGNSYDNSGIFSPGLTSIIGAGSNSSTTTFNLSDSGTGGTIKALGFDLSHGTTVNVTGDLVLNATGTATLANNLSGAGTGTISPTSTFLYTGTAAGTLTSSRTIGRLAVGTGAAASTLSLAAANLTTGADITVNTSGILNLAGFNLTESPVSGATSGGLSGAGVVADTSATAATLALNTEYGTGIFSGILENKSTGSTTGTLALSLTNTGGGSNVQILSGANTFTGGTAIASGTLVAESSSALGTGAVTVASGAALDYQAISSGSLTLGSTLGITGGTGTTIGGSIGTTTTGDEIKATGAATASGAVKVNVYGAGNLTTATTGTYTLLTGATGSTLSTPTYTLGFVYNNTNFTLTNPSTPFTSTATALNVAITSQTALTSEYWVGGLNGATTVWAASNGSTASNWVTAASGGATALVPGSTATVNIAATTTSVSPQGTTLGANMSILGLNISSAVGLGLNADGNTLTIGTGGITVGSGVAASTIAANLTLGAAQTWTNNSTNAFTVSGPVGGTGNLSIAGTGTTVLSGNSTYTGTTTISTTGTGKLQLSSLNAAQDSIITIGATNDLTFSGATLFNIGGLTGTANEALVDTSSNGITLAVGNGNNTASYGGVLSGVGGLTKVGSGTQTLTNTNTYTGLLSLNGGYLDANTAGIDGSNTAYGIAFNGGTLQAISGGITTAKTISLVGTGTIDTTSGNVTLSGNINGAGTLTKAGTGTLSISGSANTFTTLTLNDGTVLDLTSSISALGSITGLTNFSAPGVGSPILDLGGNSPTIGLLQGLGTAGATNGVITNSGSTLSTLTIGGGSSRNFGGVIQDGTGGIALNIIQTQASTGQTLFGTNTYSGGTTISGSSTVALGANGTLGSGSLTLTANGTTAATSTILNLATAQDTTVGSLSGSFVGGANAGDTQTINTQTGYNLVVKQTTGGTYAGVIAGAGGVKLNSASTAALTLTGNNTYTGGTTVSASTLYANNTSSSTYSAPSSDPRTITASAGSATGTGGVTVASGGTFAGTGTVAPGIGSGGVVVQSGGTLASGAVQSNASPYNATSGLTINNAAGLTSALSINAGSALQFALGAGTTTGGTGTGFLAFSTPNTNSSYLNIAGNTGGEINFDSTATSANPITIDLVDLTTTAPLNTTLTLRSQNPYLLIQAGSDSDYDLITSLNGVLSVDGNGYVVGIGSSTSSYNANPFNLEVTALGGTTPINGSTNYQNLQLYLYNGDLEVVPEPGTWALMLGGLALLVVVQRRRNKGV